MEKIFNRFEVNNGKKLYKNIFYIIIILTFIGIVTQFSLNSPESLKNTSGEKYFAGMGYNLFTIAVFIFFMYVISIYSEWIIKKLMSIKMPWTGILVLINIVLLGLVFNLGKEVNGAKRWISIFGFFDYQPSEGTKLIVILHLAYTFLMIYYLENYNKKDKIGSELLENIGLTIGQIALIGFTGFSSALQVFLIYLVLFLQERKTGKFLKKYIFQGLIIMFIIIFLLGLLLLGKSYRLSRVANFGKSEHEIWNAKILSNSGLFGRGYGNGMGRNFYLPEVQTDYVFTGFAEEWGFIGVLVLITIFMFFIYYLFMARKFTKNIFEKTIVTGVAIMITNQIIFHIAINLGILPSTGVTLPLISKGLSSSGITYISLGLVLGILNKNSDLEMKK